MKIYTILLVLAGFGTAFSVVPDYFGIQDTGSQNLQKLDVNITIDCESKALGITVFEAEKPVEGATAYLFYTDYGYQPLPTSGKTDSSGFYLMNVPGTLKFLTGLFILKVEHAQHQGREIEFTYQKCFEEPLADAPEPADIPVHETGVVYGDEDTSHEGAAVQDDAVPDAEEHEAFQDSAVADTDSSGEELPGTSGLIAGEAEESIETTACTSGIGLVLLLILSLYTVRIS